MKVAYIIDSSASISKELLQHPDVYVVELTVTWGEKVYNDTSNENLMKEFYSRISTTDSLPKTSQPEPAKFVQAYQTIVDKGYDAVLCITLASAISGTFNTARMVADEFNSQLTTYVIDSKGTSFLMEKMLEIAIRLEEAGTDLPTIQEKLVWFADEAKIYVVLENLENLVKGGRLNTVSAFLGNQLKIKPILHFDDDGHVDVFEKVRTTKRVYRRWLELIDEAIERYPAGIEIALAHGDAEESALEVKALIQAKYPDIQFRIGYLTPVLGTHGGKDALGMGILPKVV